MEKEPPPVSAVPRTVQPDREQLQAFVDVVFSNLPAEAMGGHVVLRSFVDDATQGGRQIFTRRVKLDRGLGPVVDTAWRAISKSETAGANSVFCPPIAVFKADAVKAGEADLLAGPAIVAELDQDPASGRKRLEDVLGPATLVIESGGRVVVEDMDLTFPKLHLYWVLDVAAMGAGLPRLKMARRLAAHLGGADPTSITVVHPLRWPGSLHCKDPSALRLCRIVGGQRDRRINLDAALLLLEDAAGPGAAAQNLESGGRVDDRETQDIVRALVAGEGFHPNLTPLAMRMAVAHVPQPLTDAVLRGIMLGVGGPADARWADRYAHLEHTISSAYARVAFEAAPAWAAALAGPNGRLRGDWNTVYRALRTAPLLRDSFRWDKRAGAVEIWKDVPWAIDAQVPRPFGDSDLTNLCVYLTAAGLPLEGDNVVLKCLTAVAQMNAVDPVVAYLNGLVWDQVPRLSTWLSVYCGAQGKPPFDETYLRDVGTKWMISAAARALDPGCKADCVLILEGDQGIQKSGVFRTLAGPWFSDQLGDLSGDQRETAMRLQGFWIIEVAELDAMRKADVSRVKDFFSRTDDVYRAPWGKIAERRPRRCVFGGSVNPTGDNSYLLDQTGNRRFWPVAAQGLARLDGMIDLDGLTAARDQLWAEAVALFKAGQSWWLNRAESENVEGVQDARTIEDTWQDVLGAWIAKDQDAMRMGGITIAEALHHGLLIPPERQSRAAQVRAGVVLRALGWEVAGRARPRRYFNFKPG